MNLRGFLQKQKNVEIDLVTFSSPLGPSLCQSLQKFCLFAVPVTLHMNWNSEIDSFSRQVIKTKYLWLRVKRRTHSLKSLRKVLLRLPRRK